MPKKYVPSPAYAYAFPTPRAARAAYARLRRFAARFPFFPSFSLSHASIVSLTPLPPALWERISCAPPPETCLIPLLPL